MSKKKMNMRIESVIEILDKDGNIIQRKEVKQNGLHRSNNKGRN